MSRESKDATGKPAPGQPASIILLLLLAAAMYTCTTRERPDGQNQGSPDHPAGAQNMGRRDPRGFFSFSFEILAPPLATF